MIAIKDSKFDAQFQSEIRYIKKKLKKNQVVHYDFEQNLKMLKKTFKKQKQSD
jgi:hypothetical protein